MTTPMNQANAADAMGLKLGTAPDIREVHLLHDALQQALVAQSMVQLDASNIEQIDLSVLQVLAVFVQDAREIGLEVGWDQPSEAFLATVRLLGLGAVLALDGE